MRLIDRLGRLPLVIVLGWIVAAFLAVMVGVVGIGLVGSGLLTPRQGAAVTEEEVRQALEETSAEPSSSRLPSPSPSSPPSPDQGTARSFPTAGGIVVAECDRILSLSPAQGFEVHEQDDDEGEFRAVRGRDRVKVELTGCDQGTPRLRIRADD
ncbi:hypothetical protein Aph02nite_09120 [Actinoplanes philippinensis]|uniref:Septum formation initiator n=1 Tax=Actinoplanes philippinensis TaxID=35752 RepID=A0A1I2AFA3_9ACTN|nr:hypothetical protein [Actinoplanes philippinensis]GIE74962.1 hypothetical protein Aph02nite_09120 [Actinoplanes philippinensis]SFE41510.1 hypothetical protein SAMN05421541_101630 [Actinoplanes philippinensis]